MSIIKDVTGNSNFTRNLFLIISLAVLSFGFMPACSNDTSPPIRIGTNVWPGYEPLYLARNLNYYSPEEVRLVEFSSSSEVIRQFRNNSLDAAALTLDETLILLQDGFDVSVILVMDISDGGDVILGKKELKDFQDIKGHTVGVEGSALGAYFLSRAMEINGIKPEEIKIVQRDVSEHEQAFMNGEIDVVATFEPVRTKLLAHGAKVLFDSKQLPGEIVDVLIVRSSYLKEHPDRINSVLDGWFKAIEYMKKDPSDAAVRMALRHQITAAVFLSSLDGLYIPDYAENLKMLSGESATLKQVLPKLSSTMYRKKLLEREIDTSLLIDGKPMRQLKQ